MTSMKTWALVADGVRARLLRDLEVTAKGGAAPGELIQRARVERLREIMADRPGRSFASDRTGRRSAMEHAADPVHEDMCSFARELSVRLDEHRLAGDFNRLAVVAAPAMLGVLRAEMSPALKSMVCLEVPKNLMGAPAETLRQKVWSAIQNARWA